MKRADLKPGLAVYYVGGSYDWDNFRENIDDARWTVADDKRYTRSQTWGRDAIESATGTLVKISRPRDLAGGAPGGTYERYVSLGKLRGLYDEIAPQRREAKAKHDAAVRERDDLRKAHRDRRRALMCISTDAGFPAYMSNDPKFVKIDVEVFARLLDAAGLTVPLGPPSAPEKG
jgi:hypothetical protein